MKIEELESDEGGGKRADGGKVIVSDDAKRVFVGAGARILFYPTLLYNVFRNKIEADFRWWDEIDQVLYVLIVCSSVFICSTMSFGHKLGQR